MIGDLIVPEREVLLYRNSLAAILFDELQLSSGKTRRLTKKLIKEMLDVMWTIMVSEVLSGNYVYLPFGKFLLKVERKYGRVNYEVAGIKKKIRPAWDKRVKLIFKPSESFNRSIQHLVERYDAQQTARGREKLDQRRLERAARRGKRLAYARVGSEPSREHGDTVRGGDSDSDVKRTIQGNIPE